MISRRRFYFSPRRFLFLPSQRFSQAMHEWSRINLRTIWKQKAHPEGHAHYNRRFDEKSLHEHKINCENQANEGSQVIPMQGFALEEDRSENGKDNQGNHLLNDLQLHEGERTSVFCKTDTVCGNLEKVLEKGNRP